MKLQLVSVLGDLFYGFQKPQQRTLSSVVVVRSQHLGCDSKTVFVEQFMERCSLLAGCSRKRGACVLS